jgi:hypothetical protein
MHREGRLTSAHLPLGLREHSVQKQNTAWSEKRRHETKQVLELFEDANTSGNQIRDNPNFLKM